ncbi:MAG: MptD family putative ECF transporter S component [Desulfovibrio sp.]|jgi:energy-coupling factor transport system substrate-specific component|nr:MptD family putative ECF transporter S component [Desulfovibrio sp.]
MFWKNWPVRDLITVGIFAAIIKIASLVVAFAGGGMNPLTLLLKNGIHTTLLVVLLYKVRRFGTLTLFICVSAVVGLLLMGSGITLLPAMIVAGLLAEACILLWGGYGNALALVLGVALFDLLGKSLSLGLSWVMMREQPALLITVSLMVAVGYAGSVMGLGGGVLFVRELRHAGIVRR